MSKQQAQWFDVNREGLGAILERRGKEFAVLELVSNGLDTGATQVTVTLEEAEKRGYSVLIVEDDDPDGFKDLTHAYTLFAPSDKKAEKHLGKRGRFNLGEKLVLSLCESAAVYSTTGAVKFDAKGRTVLKAKRSSGSVFTAVIRLGAEDRRSVARAMRSLIVPADCKVVYNGEELPQRTPVKTFNLSLETEIADEEGILRRVTRKTEVRLYDPLPDETASIYELGIPVVECSDRWHADIQQKVPLSLERDNVPPAYLRKLRTAIANEMYPTITTEDANSVWAREALGSPDVSEAAATKLITERFGEKVVSFDPNDLEANKVAVAAGFSVIHGRNLAKSEWENVRKFDLVKPAGTVTPSNAMVELKAEGKPPMPPEKWTEDMCRVAKYSQLMAQHLLGHSVEVVFHNLPTETYAAAYAERTSLLIFNVGRLGYKWFANSNESAIDSLLLHELAHDAVSDHLDHGFHQAICDLGARLKKVANHVQLSNI